MRATPKPTALHQVRTAVLANMRPGLVLWSGLVLLLLAYLWSPAVQSGLTQWGTLKQAWGYPGSFVTYAAFAVLVPELLAWAVLRQPVPRTIARDMAFAIVVFGLIGISVDVLYSVQVALFGSGNDAATIVKKMLFDQFVYSPVSNFVMVAVFLWTRVFAPAPCAPWPRPTFGAGATCPSSLQCGVCGAPACWSSTSCPPRCSSRWPR